MCAVAAEAEWRDSGIRVTVSKIAEITYGPALNSPASFATYATTSSPQRTMRSTNVMAATSRLPQTTNTIVTYDSTHLATSKWISFVDSTFNGENPCMKGDIASTFIRTGSHSGTRKTQLEQGPFKYRRSLCSRRPKYSHCVMQKRAVLLRIPLGGTHTSV